MKINGDEIILHKNEIGVFNAAILNRLEELLIENQSLKRKLEKIKHIEITEIKNNELLPDQFCHLSNLN